MSRKLFLHIGQHKTGTTSIQRALDLHSDTLFKSGLYVVRRDDYFHLGSMFRPRPGNETNLYDLAEVVLRPTLMTSPRLQGWCPIMNHDRRLRFARALNATLHELDGDALVLSSEQFSFMREPSEREYLAPMLAGFDVHTLLFERETGSWLHSFRLHEARLFELYGHVVGERDTLFDYSPDSWLRDLTPLKALFPDLTVMDYEAALARDGSTIPAFLRWLGVEPDSFDGLDTLWENASTQRARGA